MINIKFSPKTINQNKLKTLTNQTKVKGTKSQTDANKKVRSSLLLPFGCNSCPIIQSRLCCRCLVAFFGNCVIPQWWMLSTRNPLWNIHKWCVYIITISLIVLCFLILILRKGFILFLMLCYWLLISQWSPT